jgi:diguanylate cyclase (GGDEF)-like protein
MNHFHETTLPSVEFVRGAIKALKGLTIKTIYPRLGQVIKEKEVRPLLNTARTYDFYNTNQVVLRTHDKNVSYNYESICNHMLKRLETRYHREEIASVFEDSDIILEMVPYLEIKESILTGYKLWNAFFDLVYQKKGIIWLNLLEPVVSKYTELYHIQPPMIYQTKAVSQLLTIESLKDEKQHLYNEVKTLSSKIIETTDKLLRCSITGLYNEEVLRKHLLENMSQVNKTLESGLLLIHIDNLSAINKKHGPHKGDETLRHLVHLIERIKKPESLVFKQEGPGIFIYKQNVPLGTIKGLANHLRKAITESELFIETITISQSIVTINELSEGYAIKEKTDEWIEIAKTRLEHAKTKGPDTLLDQASDDLIMHDGMILLVDEDETYQNLMGLIFKRIDYKVLVAKDIDEALEMIENHPIDIIISEINLSKLDGFMLKARLNATSDYAKVPFIIASHHKTIDVIRRANLLDVDLVLQKPLIPEEILGHVKRMKEMRRFR